MLISLFKNSICSAIVVIAIGIGLNHLALAQVPTFAGNAQHTSDYSTPAVNLNIIKWTASIDFHNVGVLTHYGSPLITSANTILAPVKTASDGFRVDAFDAPTGTQKYSVASDYILPIHSWIPTYNPCVVGTRMYFAGAGGTIWHIDNIDANVPTAPVRDVFYTSLTNYNANAAAYNATIFVNTPITADAAGNIFFGFRVQGNAPAPLNTTQSGYARLDPNGSGAFVLVGAATNDPLVSWDSHNSAPALSKDGNTLYAVAKSSTTANYGYLIGFNSVTLQTKYLTLLRDPRNGNPAGIPDNGTSSPMVGPDGDVFFGAFANPNNGSRGFLLHFSADLSTVKTPGGFGWDYTPGVVPASMIPSYNGPSSYLLFCKLNDYAVSDGSGVNRVAILDPNDTQVDPHPSANGLVEMREVLTVISPTPDPQSNLPFAVKEFCINAPAVNPATNSVFFDNEDGHLYRWNLAANSLDQAIVLTEGFGQPYVPSVVGPDGTVYTLNGGNLFSLGTRSGAEITISSSSPDLRNTVVGNSLTFTATVTGTGPSPTGTVSFKDVSYDGATVVTSTIADSVPLDAGGHAVITTSSLVSGGGNFGNHFITATYSGDQNHTPTSVTMVQKVHELPSATVVTPSANVSNLGQPVTFTAMVSALPSIAGTPTGMVTFFDGFTVMGQVPLNLSGVASITRSNLVAGDHSIRAVYASDTRFAASEGSVVQQIQNGVTLQFAQSSFGVAENAGSAVVTVTRSGDPGGTASANYRTVDTDTFTVGCSDIANTAGRAFGRCDYATSVDTITFAPGEVSKTISVPIIDDALVEGTETFSIVLSDVTGGTLGAPSTATITINDNDSTNGANPIFTTPFFVRQHYLDFLSREPEPNEPWSAVLNNCPDVNNDPTCDRLTVSSAFFGSQEFQLKGYFVYRFYQLAFNRLPSYPEIVVDMRAVTGQTGSEVFQKKAAYTNAFVLRAEFVNQYNSVTNAQFVTTLMGRHGLTQITTPDPAAPDGTTKVTLTTSDLITQLVSGTLTRAQVLRAIADSEQVFAAEYNAAFVSMQYFGYLRRTPDAAGYDAWLTYLNAHPTDFRTMVNGFMNSAEYRLRFGLQ